MPHLGHRLAAPGAWGLLLVACTASQSTTPPQPKSTRYEDLVSLFGEWRSFQKPKLVDGVPDYGAAAMATQRRELVTMQGRLAAIDPSGWSPSQQVDYHLVRAEMNGLDFDHRVLMPWARNPAFYVTVFPDQSDQPAREGPFALGAIELWSYRFPLDAKGEAEISTALATIPTLLSQARANLTGNAKDLWIYGTRAVKQQGADLEALKSKVAEHPELVARIDAARRATDSLVAWLEGQAAGKTEPSGVGIANYDWYLKNVQLVPYTWQDEVTLMERELARARSFLALEESRNRGLPEQVPISSEAEHARRFGPAVTAYMGFLRDHDLMTIPDYLEPALRSKVGQFVPGPREFFTEVDYRDPMVMRTHGFHWFDLARLAKDPPASPMRKGPLLYNIFNTRTEGWATGWEEMMLMAGMFDQRPRSRELIYVLVGQRAARALGDLMMHANRFSLEQAVKFAAANTPRGWLRESAATVWGEQHLYLQQPGYGTSYLIGKIEGEKLLAARRTQLGADFTFRRFMDEFQASGLVPTSLIRWELAGQPEDVRRMLAP
jgi:hypothetical protein